MTAFLLGFVDSKVDLALFQKSFGKRGISLSEADFEMGYYEAVQGKIPFGFDSTAISSKGKLYWFRESEAEDLQGEMEWEGRNLQRKKGWSDAKTNRYVADVFKKRFRDYEEHSRIFWDALKEAKVQEPGVRMVVIEYLAYWDADPPEDKIIEILDFKTPMYSLKKNTFYLF